MEFRPLQMRPTVERGLRQTVFPDTGLMKKSATEFLPDELTLDHSYTCLGSENHQKQPPGFTFSAEIGDFSSNQQLFGSGSDLSRIQSLNSLPTHCSRPNFKVEIPRLRRSNTSSTEQTSSSLGAYFEDRRPLHRHASHITLPHSHNMHATSDPANLLRSQSDMMFTDYGRLDPLSGANDLTSSSYNLAGDNYNIGNIRDYHRQTNQKLRKKTTGPIHNAKYKAKLCKNWVQRGMCPYYEKCQFAHGEHEIEKWAMRRSRLKKNVIPSSSLNSFENVPPEIYQRNFGEVKSTVMRKELFQMLNEMQQRNGGHLSRQDVSKLMNVLSTGDNASGEQPRFATIQPRPSRENKSDSGIINFRPKSPILAENESVLSVPSLNLSSVDDATSVSFNLGTGKSSLQTLSMFDFEGQDPLSKGDAIDDSPGCETGDKENLQPTATENKVETPFSGFDKETAQVASAFEAFHL